MFYKFKNTNKSIFYGIICVTFLILLVLNIMTPMYADDFTYAFSYAFGNRIEGLNDVLISMRGHYYNNGGRVFAHAIVSFLTLFPWIISDILNSIVYILLGLIIYKFIFVKYEINSKMLAIIYISLFITIPAFGQSALWFVGSVNYLWTITLMVAFLFPYMSYIITEDSKLNSKFGYLFVVVGLMMGACNENSSPATALCAILMVIYMIYKKQKIRLWMILGILSSFITWYFVISSPGNSVRSTNNGIGEISFMFLKDCFMNCIALIQGEQKWLLISVIILILLSIKYNVSQNKIIIAIILVISGAASNFAMTLSPIYPARAFIATEIYTMIAGLILFYELTIEWIKVAKIFVIVYMCYTFSINFICASNSIFTTYIWNEQRKVEIQNEIVAGNTDIVTYRITSSNPYSVFYIEYGLSDDPSFWVNDSFAKYYDLNSVIVTETKSTK